MTEGILILSMGGIIALLIFALFWLYRSAALFIHENYMIGGSIALMFFSFYWLYYSVSFGVHENYEIFLTISTFLFAIFTGFFISRQGTRYSQISDQIARFDGSLTSLYRSFSYLGSAMFKKAHNIIERHYDIILNKESWDYHFTHKSTTLTDLYALAATFAKSRKLPSAQHLALGRILNSLENLQITRKTMVSLHGERIPRLQWAFNIFLGSILLLTLSTIPAQGYFLGAALKASFATTVVFILVLLYRFDTLQFFENMTGESSARDVLNILEGKR